MMADEFPDPDEEFDFIHQEDYEVLRELESELPKKNQLSQSALSGISQVANINKQQANVHTCSPTGFDEIIDDGVSNNRKRSHEELFDNISDLLTSVISEPKEKRLRWDEPEGVIRKILDTRQLIHKNTVETLTKVKYVENKKNSISFRVPPWNFVAVTRTYDCQRLYVKVRSTLHSIKQSIKPANNLLSIPYGQLKAQAEEVIARKNKLSAQVISDDSDTKNVINDELWVDKYQPRSYLELLSDETVNRQLLRWLKFWDKIVFNRNIVELKRNTESFQFRKKAKIEDDNIEEIDNKGYPVKRIALLSGPPGLGKTTLAHIAARHAGYNVVEINASDERSPDTFRQILLASTEMKAVIGADPRPNCLVFDEIDGAPTASIDLLLKFVQGKLASKAKKSKKQSGQISGCARPIICICNEPYTPTLRTLRAAAVIIPVPEVNPLRLAERLMEIARKEKLNVDFGDLVKVAETSGCDVRSCVGALQYMGNTNLKDNISLGLKDIRKNLFDSWKSILTIPVNRKGVANISERIQNILRTIQNGESDKLVQGIFHNYLEICDHRLDDICSSLEWFQFYDSITLLVAQKQLWSLLPYTNYGFIAWHLHLARTQKMKLSYPIVFSEMIQKSAKNTGILTAIRRVCGRDAFTLAIDIAAFLPDLLTPRLRIVPSHLYSAKEKADLVRIVNVMLEFGLSFVQEKNLQGGYIYNLDPNILEIGVFSDCSARRSLAYAVQQIIAQELEVERLKRTSISTELGLSGLENLTGPTNHEVTENIQGKSNEANEANQSERKMTPLKKVVYKDFFGNITNEDKSLRKKDKSSNRISPNSQKGYSILQHMLTKHGIWYKYKEGCNNAVRRSVLMEKFL